MIKIKGHIKSENGVLIVEEGALIDAEMDVGSAIIKGDVNGKLTARKKIEIFSPGRFTGKIFVPVLSIEKGVIFNGKCFMGGFSESVIKTADFNGLKK